MWVCVCVWERERESVCVWEREREREREREKHGSGFSDCHGDTQWYLSPSPRDTEFISSYLKYPLPKNVRIKY